MVKSLLTTSLKSTQNSGVGFDNSCFFLMASTIILMAGNELWPVEQPKSAMHRTEESRRLISKFLAISSSIIGFTASTTPL